MNVINKENQILLIEEFILSDEETIIINQVNDEIYLFLLGICEILCR